MYRIDLYVWAIICSVALVLSCALVAWKRATQKPRSALCLSCTTDAVFRGSRGQDRSSGFLDNALTEATIIRKRKWLATNGHHFFGKLLSDSCSGNCANCGRRLEALRNDDGSLDRLQIVVDNADDHLDAIQRSHRNATLMSRNQWP